MVRSDEVNYCSRLEAALPLVLKGIRESCGGILAELVTFPENPRQNDQKIRETQKTIYLIDLLVPDFPGWGLLGRRSSAKIMRESRYPSPFRCGLVVPVW